ncbi:MAG: GCN5-related N-acetyltransferase [Firmicutes bacterium]|nr:GCN5-related N-acetyltransferase [Bacillota bacterium]
MIKEYTEAYKEQIINLILDIQQNEFQIQIKKEDQPDLSDIANFYQSGSGNFWVAVDQDCVIGTIALIDIGNRQGALRKMFVKSSYRGKIYNVAKVLLQTAIEWAKKHNMQDIYLGTTEKFLAAHRFYEKNQFIQLLKENLPRNFPVMKVDTRFYKLQIKKGNGFKSMLITDPEGLEKAYAIRREVFVAEQKVPEELELDAYDKQESTKHVLLVDQEYNAVGTARFRPYNDGVLKIERVAVLAKKRGAGSGKTIMEAIEAEAKKTGYQSMRLSAQTHARKFYERLGFEAKGEIYLEAGIEHIDMFKKI